MARIIYIIAGFAIALICPGTDNLIPPDARQAYFEPGKPGAPCSRCTSVLLSSMETRLYCPTVMVKSSSCFSSYMAEIFFQVGSVMKASAHSLSTAFNKAASNGVQPGTSGPLVIRSISQREADGQ